MWMKHFVDTLHISGIREFSEMYINKEDCIFLTIGEPDFNTPTEIKDALKLALDENHTHYPPICGNHELRQKIAKLESMSFFESYTENNVIITNGATEALILAMGVLLGHGDNVMIPTPCFPLYQTQALLTGAEVSNYDTSTHGFQLRYHEFSKHIKENTKVIVLASPNNPTGIVYDEESMITLHRLMEEHPDLYIIIDEVYRSMIYEGDYPSIRDYESTIDRVILVQSFSKTFAMTGWRVGYAVAQESLIKQMNAFHQNLVTGVATFIQEAAITALDVDTQFMLDEYDHRRKYLLERLALMDVDYIRPEGAFYIFIDIRKYGMDSYTFCKQLADELGVVIIPGIFFGTEGFARISYGANMDALENGLDRLDQFIREFCL